MSDLALRPVWMMTDDELLAEVSSISTASDSDALRNPVALARHLDPKYKLRPHLRLIGDALATVQHGSGDRLMILTPPQVGKTVSVAVWFPFWWLCQWPADHVVIGSYNNNLALARGRSVRKLVNEHGHRFGITLERGSRAANDWELVSGGGVKSVGVGGGVTGKSGDLIVIDDPHKSRAEADSLTVRNKVWEWMSGDVNSRRQPNSPICVIMTRWHEDDLGGRLIKEQGRVEEGGLWRVIHMPAFAGTLDPLGREPGDPLPHPKISPKDREALVAHWEERRSTSTVRDWHALYMGDPKPTEGALVTEEMMRDRSIPASAAPPPVVSAVAVDPSGGGRDEAGIIAGFRGTDNRVYWTHDLTAVMPTANWATATVELAYTIDAELIVFESNFGGDQAGLIIRTAWDVMCTKKGLTNRLCPRIIQVSARKNKRLRAEPVSQQIIEDRVRLVGHHPELIQQWCFAAGTLVTTARGPVPIEEVRASDRVWTRAGWKKVAWAGCTGSRQTMVIRTESGVELRCTPEHQIWIDGQGWTPALKVQPGDRIPTCPLTQVPRSLSTGSDTHKRKTGTSRPLAVVLPTTGLLTARSGRRHMALSHPGGMSRSLTETSPTSTLPTCDVALGVGHENGRSTNSNASWWNSRGSATSRTQTDTSRRPAPPACCTEPSGLTTTGPSRTAGTSITVTKTAPTTTSPTSLRSLRTTTSVASTDMFAEPSLKTPRLAPANVAKSGSANSPAKSPVPNAGWGIPQSGSGPASVSQRVQSVSTITGVTGDAEPVYDITVEDQHEFYANGLLVHNCTWMPTDSASPGRIDASVYLTVALLGNEPTDIGTVTPEPEGGGPSLASAPALPVMPGTPRAQGGSPTSLPVAPGFPSRGGGGGRLPGNYGR